MPPPLEGNTCVWIISCLFFLVIIAGGGFFAMYITLPESSETSWFPLAGMALVGIPWVFWLMTFVYRCLFKGGVVGPERAQLPPNNVSPTPPVVTLGAPKSPTDSPVDSPGGARRVRFGGAVVMGTRGQSGEAPAVQSHGEDEGGEGDSSSHVTSASDASSLASRECEFPLAFAMSS
ncbi:uncharacterized protein LOC143857673 [Tasmannia lanceolata]|uniref:uncharacterized protein LOC143857673 n=1 Tax=Tasmannia lanceolata TaxID=3420 RepID=UPI0040630940